MILLAFEYYSECILHSWPYSLYFHFGYVYEGEGYLMI
jgi:hypothetical protein